MTARPRVFISYSSRDAEKADAIRAAIEAAGIACWIAPRDLTAGTRWGGGIVQALDACEAVVVVFSAAANGSPQIARELEIAVSRRRPLIPVRIEDAQPTDDMQFFLGVSHWFNAFPAPIETYLPDVVGAVSRVLAEDRRPWRTLRSRLPASRGGQIGLSVAVAAAVALIVGIAGRPGLPAGAENPLAGRWSARIGGAQTPCVLEVPKTAGLASFSDDCPSQLAGSQGTLLAAASSVYAPDQFRTGDGGTFEFLGGSASFYKGAYRTGWFGALTTRDATFGEIAWRRVSGAAPASDASAAILSPGAPWPLKGAPDVARRALQLARAKWKPDAVLMSVDLKPDPSGHASAVFEVYSPASQQVAQISPGSAGGLVSPPIARLEDASEAIPDTFLDLPDAVARAAQDGMQGRDVSEATLGWSGGPACGTGDFRKDNAILPKCPPGRFVGIQWEIQSAIGETRYVPAQ